MKLSKQLKICSTFCVQAIDIDPLLGTENIGAYLRRMAVYGYMVEVDMEPLNTLTTHLNRIGNNINQLAKRANETGNIYLDDIEKIGSDISEMKSALNGFTQQIFDEIG